MKARLVPPQGKLALFQPAQCQTQVAKERSCGKNGTDSYSPATETRSPLREIDGFLKEKTDGLHKHLLPWVRLSILSPGVPRIMWLLNPRENSRGRVLMGL